MERVEWNVLKGCWQAERMGEEIGVKIFYWTMWRAIGKEEYIKEDRGIE